MQQLMKSIAVLLLLSTLTACALPKRPPSPTSHPRPVNSLATAEMLAHESGFMIVGQQRESKQAKEYLLYNGDFHIDKSDNRALVLDRPRKRGDYALVPGARMVERTVRVPFGFASYRFRPTPAQQFQIQQLLAVADRIEVRGRTDGRGTKAADEKTARLRAEAAKRYLLGRGAPSNIIAINYQAAGDYIADNHHAKGRNKNRRVEIEFFIDDFTVTRTSRPASSADGWQAVTRGSAL